MRLHELSERTLVKLSESELISGIKKLQEGFTTKREKIAEYLSSPKLVSAYTLFYLPTNLPKFKFLIDQLSEKVRTRILSQVFVDYGTGPGTFLAALLEEGGDPKRLIGIDISELMLKQAKECVRFYGKEVFLSKTLPQIDDPFTLCLGHSINEMGVDKVSTLIKKSRPTDILIFEPGTPVSFKGVLKLRDQLISMGYHCSYPCPSFQNLCSMDGDSNWCHQVIKMTHDPQLERLSQLVRLDRRSMPLIAHHYSKDEKEHSLNRVIRIVKETKFSYELEICHGSNELDQIEVLKKELSKVDIKRLKKLTLGGSCLFETISKDEKRWRVRLTSF